MKQFFPLGFALILLISACDNNEDQAKTVDKGGSIEVSLTTKHLDSLTDLVTTHYIVWRRGTRVKEFDKRDTVPSLGNFIAEGENGNGDTQSLNIRKEYEFYVTVK
jgi:hypothetical protein